jgi:aminoglycoside 3-N-acetyltransferase
MYSIEELATDFRNLGIEAGDTVMLHASVRAVGEVAGGPDAIHLALKSALTREGTLMMYAGCPRYYDELGRGNLTMEQEREIHEKLPASGGKIRPRQWCPGRTSEDVSKLSRESSCCPFRVLG